MSFSSEDFKSLFNRDPITHMLVVRYVDAWIVGYEAALDDRGIDWEMTDRKALQRRALEELDRHEQQTILAMTALIQKHGGMSELL